jgi:hypothetical protein
MLTPVSRLRPARRRASIAGACVAGIVAFWLALPYGATPRFYRDDPLAREPETADAAHVSKQDVELFPDLLLNLFTQPGDPASNVRARDINTIDEVPDSSWFTNRIYARPLTDEEIARGPDVDPAPASGRWTVTAAKVIGFAPGFTMKDSRGTTWFIEFDPRGFPHASTAAVSVAVRLFWALGYNQVESHIATFKRGDLDFDPKATVSPRPWRKRPLRPSDIAEVFRRAEREKDGSYRVIAGRLIPGKIVGPFKYYGTRVDDPNDLVPHEHRRSLRALRVFGAWINLNDMKAGNTLDSVIDRDGHHVVLHYLQDVGSTFGAGGNGPRDWDEGYEYLYEGDPALKRAFSLGFYLRPWQTIPYKVLPEVGRFEGDHFDPEAWVPRVPTAAFLRARDDDNFWAALRVAAFTDEQVRAAVHAGEFEDPAAETLLGDILIKRRDKIARAYLPKLTPLTRFALANGTLTFENAATRYAGLPEPDGGYRGEWFEFDNATGTTRAIGATTSQTASLAAPTGVPGLPAADGTHVKVALTAPDSNHPAWSHPVNVYFRRAGGAWTLVGVERLADGAPSPPGPSSPKTAQK